MITRLSIKNLAIVEKAEAQFGPGLNVLTGETGSGKSVIISAIDLALGAKADTGSVRDGAGEAVIEVEFDLSGNPAAAAGVMRELDEIGIDVNEDSTLVIRRHISASSGGKIRINDCAATVAALKKLRRYLIDIHGPRANQLILEERFQREILDSWGGVDLKRYQAVWEKVKSIEKRRDEALSETGDEDELDLIRFQVEEIESAALSDEDDTINERHAAAAHAREIVEKAQAITEALGGDGSAAEIMANLQSQFSALASKMDKAEAWLSESMEITERIQELSRDVADEVSRIDIDPAELDRLDERLAKVNRLRRKYGGGVAEILKVLEVKRDKLGRLENRDEILSEIERELAQANNELKAEARLVSKSRKRAGDALSKAVTKELHDLGFLQSKFSVDISERACDQSGMDRVSYLFEPNPGESARELANIASSGEIARVMLAIKGILSAHDPVAVIVFDEIDANIGGDVGRMVGEKMRSLSAQRQVIAITHLPQSAVYGRRHLVVSKSVAGGRTRTGISVADGEGRVSEIARMLGGETLTSVVKRHAKELLNLSC